jgi:uncharacterized protein (TIGR02265 family)
VTLALPPGVALPPGFALPDHTSPLDVDELCERLPRTVMIRGMFLQGLVDMCAKRGKPLAGHSGYIAFKEYTVQTHVRLVADAAAALYPELPLRRAFAVLGREAYGVLVDSMIGRVVFGVLGRDIHRITRLVNKAYEVSGHGVTATLLDLGSHHSHVRIDGAVGLVDTYHLGAFEGVVDACRRTCTIWAKVIDGGGELFTVWSEPI